MDLNIKVIICTLISLTITIFFIYQTVKTGKTVFFQKYLYKNLKNNDKFFLEKEGTYAIWVESKLFKFLSLITEDINILNFQKEKVSLKRPVFKTQHNSLQGGGKMLFYKFFAPPGYYTFHIKSKIFSKIPNAPLVNKTTLELINYGIKNNVNFIYYILFVLFMLLSLTLTILTLIIFAFGISSKY